MNVVNVANLKMWSMWIKHGIPRHTTSLYQTQRGMPRFTHICHIDHIDHINHIDHIFFIFFYLWFIFEYLHCRTDTVLRF